MAHASPSACTSGFGSCSDATTWLICSVPQPGSQLWIPAGRAEAADSREQQLKEELRQAQSLVQTLENDLLLAQRSGSSAPAATAQPPGHLDDDFGLANGHSAGVGNMQDMASMVARCARRAPAQHVWRGPDKQCDNQEPLPALGTALHLGGGVQLHNQSSRLSCLAASMPWHAGSGEHGGEVSMVSVLSAQRDRFRAKAGQLEDQLSQVPDTGSATPALHN